MSVFLKLPDLDYRKDTLIFLWANKCLSSMNFWWHFLHFQQLEGWICLLWIASFCCSAVIAVGSPYMCLSEKKRKVLQRANVRSNLLENRGVFESVLSFQLAQLISKETEARCILSTTYAWNQILQREDVCMKADGAGHLPSHPAWCCLAQGQEPSLGETW